MFRYRDLLAVSFLAIQTALSAVVFPSSSDLPHGVDYDFIIVGGGTAGGVVASRLGKNPNFKILVIEAGVSNDDVFPTHVPGLWPTVAMVPGIDWGYTLTPQSGLNGRGGSYSRAKVLGGCSSHNSMIYTRGSRDDWNRWAKITGDQGLRWDNTIPTLKNIENLTQDSSNQSYEGHLDPSIHGHRGILSVSAPYNNHPFNNKLIQATSELKQEFPFKLDMNDGRPIGVAWFQYTINHHAERSSSATTYFANTGNNVHILFNTQVTRVLPVGWQHGPDFRGVEFATDARSAKKQLVAKKEVIVSGGVINTPQILLNSGIGDQKELGALGIKTVVHNPSVGKNFSDHASMSILFRSTMEHTDFDPDAALAEWNKTRVGPFSQPLNLNNVAWVRLSDDVSPFGHGVADPTGGTDSPHFESVPFAISSQPLLPLPIPVPPIPSGSSILQHSVIDLHPVSRGSITLNSSDPFAKPLVDVGTLSRKEDVAVLREAIRSARRLYSAPAFKDSVFETILPAANVTSDDELDAYIRSVAEPFLHGVGSAGMSPRGASWGVVDPDFTVKGVRGLRVVDASVIPDTPSAHTQVSVYGFAERASMLIAQRWR